VIVLDASVLIAHFEPADVHHDRATRLMLAHRAEEFAASVISLAEIYVGAARANRMADVERAIARLSVAAVPLPAAAARRLAEIRAATNLKLPGCCVIHAAEQRHATVATFDSVLADHARRLNLSTTD
jgi:predicted nucleic acid-binding protein